MPGYLNIADPAFDQPVTLRDAYRIMERFVAAHVARGELPSGVLLDHLALAPDGVGGDPAALYDYLTAAAAVAPGLAPAPPGGSA